MTFSSCSFLMLLKIGDSRHSLAEKRCSGLNTRTFYRICRSSGSNESYFDYRVSLFGTCD